MVKRHLPKANSRALTASMKGFLVTCDSGREKQAAKDLKTTIETRLGLTSEGLKKEEMPLAGTASPSPKLLKSVETGCKGVVFLKVNPGHPKFPETDPVSLTASLFTSPSRLSPHLCRIVPITATCNVNSAKAVSALLGEVGRGGEEGKDGWRVEWVGRNCKGVGKLEVMEGLRKGRKVVDAASVPSGAKPAPTILLHANSRLLFYGLLQGAPLSFNFNLKKYYRVKHIP